MTSNMWYISNSKSHTGTDLKGDACCKSLVLYCLYCIDCTLWNCDNKVVTNGTCSYLHMEKDLGVNVDDELNFEEHVQIQTMKANKLLAMIRRSFSYIDEVSLPLLYKAIVRPHLEYCNTVWDPRWKKDMEALEAIQHRATKLVPGLGEKSYGKRLKALSLSSLYYRRARGDMIECYKYLSGVYDVSTKFLPLDLNSTTRGHSLKLTKMVATKACRANYISRCINNGVVRCASIAMSVSRESFFIMAFTVRIAHSINP